MCQTLLRHLLAVLRWIERRLLCTGVDVLQARHPGVCRVSDTTQTLDHPSLSARLSLRGFSCLSICYTLQLATSYPT